MSNIVWKKLVGDPINFEIQTRLLPTKGNLVYEYNPFRNYRLNKIMFEYKGEYYTEEELETKFGIVQHENSWMKGTVNVTDDIQLHEKGE